MAVITIKQGATYRAVATWYQDKAQTMPVDLTGYTAKMQIRPTPESTDPPLVDLANGNGLTLGGVLGTIAIRIEAADTADLTDDGVYDLLVTAPDGTADRILEGKAEVKLGVTR